MIIDVLSFVLLGLGGCFVVLGGLGVLRMPDFYTRMHAASLTDSLGTILTLAGVMLQSGWTFPTIKLATVLLFLMLTGPTAAYALAHARLLDDPAAARASGPAGEPTC